MDYKRSQGIDIRKVRGKLFFFFTALTASYAVLLIYVISSQIFIKTIFPYPEWPWLRLLFLTAAWVILAAWLLFKSRYFLNSLPSHVKFYSLMFVLFLFSAMGPVATFLGQPVTLTPFWILYYLFLPGFIFLRTSSRMAVLGIMAGYVLAAFGLSRLNVSTDRIHPAIKFILVLFLIAFTYPKLWGLHSFSIYDEINKLSAGVTTETGQNISGKETEEW